MYPRAWRSRCVNVRRILYFISRDASDLRPASVPKDDIPEGLFRQLTTCQTAANEFLRQFWLSIYPPVTEGQILSAASPAQKAAKAAKMIGYLGKTHEKVDALVIAARREGVDPARIQVVCLFPFLEYWSSESD